MTIIYQQFRFLGIAQDIVHVITEKQGQEAVFLITIIQDVRMPVTMEHYAYQLINTIFMQPAVLIITQADNIYNYVHHIEHKHY